MHANPRAIHRNFPLTVRAKVEVIYGLGAII
jgi:hypothetical protein